jgi:mannose-6-phosphate isomerase
MVGISLLSNPIREYAWGSHSAIADLLGQPVPSPRPQAELWMGAHPADSSRVRCGDRWVDLTELLREDPSGVLGASVADRFDDRLPFLFKVLAAERPLSIQAHPNREQAREGFERENAAGIDMDSPKRNYRDPYAKRELICALTPFSALRGFRAVPTIVENFRALQVDEFAEEVSALERAPDASGLEAFVSALLVAERRKVACAVAQVAKSSASRPEDPASRWILALAAQYPDDAGTLAPLFLNLVTLAPGDAMYLDAGELHSYLEGLGVEIMTNSDNVLRGGLTDKHVDVPELQRVLRFESRQTSSLHAREVAAGESVFDTPSDDFDLAVLTIAEGTPWRSATSRGVEILLLVEGELSIADCGKGDTIGLQRGGSVLIPDSVERYELSGRGVVYRAGVPEFQQREGRR